MADLATDDPRRALWERRLRPPVLLAAVAVLPLLALHLTHPHGVFAAIETAGHWAVWLTFMVEVVVMLFVVRADGRRSTATASSSSWSPSPRPRPARRSASTTCALRRDTAPEV
jgi:hypothetical protein